MCRHGGPPLEMCEKLAPADAARVLEKRHLGEKKLRPLRRRLALSDCVRDCPTVRLAGMHADEGSAMQLAQGAISDRPWGLTLGALSVARRTVQLTLCAEERVFRIDLDRGVVIGASSPVAADSVARVALA